jgi:hypothetical protein
MLKQASLQVNTSTPSTVQKLHRRSLMESDAITQIKKLLGRAEQLRETLSNGERLQLMGLTDALSNELQRPDEAVFRITFNQVCLSLLNLFYSIIDKYISQAITWPFVSRYNGASLKLSATSVRRERLVRSLLKVLERTRD